jgi:16S rRNA (guanine527-N7)-methyltransferase
MTIDRYFPELNLLQQQRLQQLIPLYADWNQKINVISRKDIDHFEVHHLLFSLAIAKIFQFAPGTRIMDAGTGGGLPGIPLAILFPETEFTLVDSIGKKIKVVESISEALGLLNVQPRCIRFETIPESFDFIIGRAVTAIPSLVKILAGKISKKSQNEFPNGLIYLTGGEIEQEVEQMNCSFRIYPLNALFEDPFFETKKIIHLYDIGRFSD